MTTTRRALAAVVAMALGTSACGDDTAAGPGTGGVATGPAPAEMCPGGQVALAAYDRVSGSYRWSVCSTDPVRRSVVSADGDAVEVAIDGGTVVTYRASDGKLLPDGVPGRPPPTVAPWPGPNPGPVVDGIRLTGGQQSPTTATDAASGTQLWTRPGSTVYSDVWAVGDGAVYVTDREAMSPTGLLVAYDLRTGAERWNRDQVSVHGEYPAWPWYVSGTDLFTMWTNLAVLSTRDGSLRWRTDYPNVAYPRMTGVRANDRTVFVAFSSIASGGD